MRGSSTNRWLCMLAVIALGSSLGSPVLAADPAGPLAPAAEGKVQCFGYDRAHKTCQSMAAYSAGPGDTVLNTASLLIAREPPIVMTTVSPVTIEGQRVCGPVRPEDLAAATFTVSGAPAPPEAAQALAQGLNRAMKDMLGKRVCVIFEPDGAGFIAHATLDSLPQPDSDQHLIWVAPNDGYTVAP